MNSQETAAPVAALPTNDWHVSIWQGRIAAAAKNGEGLDTFVVPRSKILARDIQTTRFFLTMQKVKFVEPPNATLPTGMA